MIGTFDNLDLKMSHRRLQAVLEFLALVAAIGEELDQEREEAEQAGHQYDAAITVLNVGSMDDGLHQEALGRKPQSAANNYP